ncbi:MAG TPA: tetraacyldisaccharide 4'-kinase [Xanthobacteraceae bacterium]|jgi:tetraacyldisaccharide 4'-kinase|nr:tetraacyldisaccharide 4'-kinase [Xanthobacteraceae bacterium]
MRAPAFWWKPGTGGPLTPLAALYGAVAGLRMQSAGQRAALPVICLGNLTLGGAGKTPAALAVAHMLLAAHEHPFFLSRGYGGKLAGPVRVNPAVHSAADVGDEPLLLTRLAPTIVSRDRFAGAKLAGFAGASVIVMDDGFQNPSLAKDLSILLLDGRRGIGNSRIFPAGPLRAPLGIQLDRAQALIVVGPPEGAAAVVERAIRRGVAIFNARFEPDANVLAAIGKRKVLAFAGIGDPEKFFATLTNAGIAIAERAAFPDHHRFTSAEAQSLVARTQSQALMLVTTEKDLARLSGDPTLNALAARAIALPVRLVIEEKDRFRALLFGALQKT